MILQVYTPKIPLNRFIECFIYHEGYQPAHTVDRFLPDGNVEIIIDLDDQPKFIYDNSTLREIQTCHQVWASGVRTEPISIHSGKDSSGMIIIAFKRGMAAPFFPFPMDEISDSVVDADLIWGSDFGFLRERILAAPDISRKFKIVEEFLLVNHTLTDDPCVEYALGELIRQPERIILRTLIEKIGYSQKHFISIFKRRVGVTPKAYLRLMRFQMAVREIENHSAEGELRWSDIAQVCGFYDQAHFINDFKSFSGFTPDDYASRRGEHLNYIPVIPVI